ncbi:hypothetical protein scyTo_0001509 [Scyliorhinus torazame]|uniref:Platelet glycoprotein 4 n=1 Tax=Scyliorhinus torazame TaxID=75743 RepID=A0A401PDS2_SCYTO|nr:hypothetical protein [Scyliorhinus torazame]
MFEAELAYVMFNMSASVNCLIILSLGLALIMQHLMGNGEVTEDTISTLEFIGHKRSIFAEYEQKKKLKEIPVHRFVVPPKALASFLENPDNHCYCKDMSVSQNCTFGGILGISICKEKKPIYISLPHFLYATDKIVNAVDGLSPNKEEHETFLDVEPVTGFTLRVAKRIQINLMFKPSKKIKILKNIKEPIFFPLVWLNETGTVDDETAKVFRGSLTTPMTALGITQLTLICIGSLLFLSCVIAICRTLMKKETTKKNVGMEKFETALRY